MHAYAKHTGNPRVSRENFDAFVVRYAKRFAEDYPDLAMLLGGKRDELITAGLTQLEESGVVQLEKGDDGTISSIYYPAFYTTEIARWYGKMQNDKDIPFPAEEDLDVTIPAGILHAVDVTDGIMHFLESDEVDESQILLLRFPHGVRPVTTTVELLRGQLLPLSLAKVRDYLRTGKNAGYMETKMRAIFRNREMLVRDMIENAQTRPDDALQSIREPNEFQFHFWTQISSMIIKEYAQKTEKLSVEHSYCQAAFLLGYYSVFFKGRHQKDQKREETHRILTDALQKPPYSFTVQEIYNLTDDKGVPLTKRVTREEINGWLDEMIKRPSSEKISELVTINTPEKTGLMIHSKQYIPLLMRQIKAAQPVLVKELTAEMVQTMLEERVEPWLEDPAAFENVLEKKVRDEFSLLYGLCTFQTLFLVIDGQELPQSQRDAALSLIDPPKKSMRTWTEIFRIDQGAIYRDARLHLPFWMLVPVLRGIVRLLKKMFGTTNAGRPRGSSGSVTYSPIPDEPNAQDTAAAKSAQEAKRKKFFDDIAVLQKEFVNSDETPDQKLRKLRDQWNPILDPVKRDNLVEDVNALCRDMLRRMRYSRTMQAPDRARIEELAKRIAANSAFDRITRRKAFETYLKLYLLTVLQRM
ncbi:MAG: hypothetical protein ACLFSV_11815 [Alkalispirochaeta sp.]